MKIRQVQCKTILSKSSLADYCLNCYTGCAHGCRYCYARFMQKYTNHQEPWGEFVDIKINAAEVLEKEVKKKKKGEVFVSSVCDGWQPAEAEYKLTRKCAGILLEHGFSVSILTKSALVERDFDLFKSYLDSLELGFTITTLNENIRSIFEPKTSPANKRISILRKAADLGIKSYVFLGPLLPYFSDNAQELDQVFLNLGNIRLERIYVDKLNLRFGVWESICPVLKKYDSRFLTQYKNILFNKVAALKYSAALSERVRFFARRYGLENKLRILF